MKANSVKVTKSGKYMFHVQVSIESKEWSVYVNADWSDPQIQEKFHAFFCPRKFCVSVGRLDLPENFQSSSVIQYAKQLSSFTSWLKRFSKDISTKPVMGMTIPKVKEMAEKALNKSSKK